MAQKNNTRIVGQELAVEVAHAALTAESIAASITAGVDLIGRAFHEPEQRVLADNGKRYPLDVSLPDGVTTDGEVVTVNRYAFLQRQLIGCLVWKLEAMLDDQDKRITEQRSKIRAARRDIDLGRVTEAMVQRMADFLETLVDQRTVVLNAFNAAREAHVDVLGEEFETRAMKAERERFVQSRRSAAGGVSPLDDQLARLGC